MNCILVVDDDPGVRQLTQILLKTEGYEVKVAGNGVEGLEVIRAVHPAIVILDLQMPVMGGVELFREIDGPNRPPVVIMSAFNADQVIRDLGAEACNSKPYNPLDLVKEVESLMVKVA